MVHSTYTPPLAFQIGECISLIGNYSKILIERLCIRALLSERHGGFGSSYVLIIDAGKSSDIYSSVMTKLPIDTAQMIGEEVFKVDGSVRDVISISKLLKKYDGPEEVRDPDAQQIWN